MEGSKESDIDTMVRFTRAITNHAPIGEYRERFKLPGRRTCLHHVAVPETREHCFECSELYKHLPEVTKAGRYNLEAVNDCLKKNKTMFSFVSWEDGAITTLMNRIARLHIGEGRGKIPTHRPQSPECVWVTVPHQEPAGF